MCTVRHSVIRHMIRYPSRTLVVDLLLTYGETCLTDFLTLYSYSSTVNVSDPTTRPPPKIPSPMNQRQHRSACFFSSSKFRHITPLLRQLHWLKAPERIAYLNMQSSCTSVFTGLHLHTLSTSFVRWQMSRLVGDSVPVHPHR